MMYHADAHLVENRRLPHRLAQQRLPAKTGGSVRLLVRCRSGSVFSAKGRPELMTALCPALLPPRTRVPRDSEFPAAELPPPLARDARAAARSLSTERPAAKPSAVSRPERVPSHTFRLRRPPRATRRGLSVVYKRTLRHSRRSRPSQVASLIRLPARSIAVRLRPQQRPPRLCALQIILDSLDNLPRRINRLRRWSQRPFCGTLATSKVSTSKSRKLRRKMKTRQPRWRDWTVSIRPGSRGWPLGREPAGAVGTLETLRSLQAAGLRFTASGAGHPAFRPAPKRNASLRRPRRRRPRSKGR